MPGPSIKYLLLEADGFDRREIVERIRNWQVWAPRDLPVIAERLPPPESTDLVEFLKGRVRAIAPYYLGLAPRLFRRSVAHCRRVAGPALAEEAQLNPYSPRSWMCRRTHPARTPLEELPPDRLLVGEPVWY